MKFFAIHLSDLESEEFTIASDAQRSTWIFLHAFCSKLANNGIIEDAAAIAGKLWQRHGIEHHDILPEPSPLWNWQDGNLVLRFYDQDGQDQFEKRVVGGRKGANERWNKGTPAGTPSNQPNSSPNSTPISSPNAHNPTQPNITKQNKTEHENTEQNMTGTAHAVVDPVEAQSIGNGHVGDADPFGLADLIDDFGKDGIGMDGMGSPPTSPAAAPDRSPVDFDAIKLATWQVAARSECTVEEINAAFSAAKKNDFKGRDGKPIGNAKGFIVSYAKSMRANAANARQAESMVKLGESIKRMPDE